MSNDTKIAFIGFCRDCDEYLEMRLEVAPMYCPNCGSKRIYEAVDPLSDTRSDKEQKEYEKLIEQIINESTEYSGARESGSAVTSTEVAPPSVSRDMEVE